MAVPKRKHNVPKCKSSRTGTMKQIPEQERPYEKCASMGPDRLSDAELLAVLLRTGTRGETSLALAQRILTEIHPSGILGLLHLSLPELMEKKGIGRVKGIELLCVGELSRRIWRTMSMEEAVTFTSPTSIAAFCMEEMRHMEQEELHVMMLNTKHALIRDVLLFRGTVNMSVASPREIFIEALRYHAVSIILVHNHPSGDPAPSKEDKRLTERIRDAGSLVGINLLDHVIIGDQSYFSFKERGLL